MIFSDLKNWQLSDKVPTRNQPTNSDIINYESTFPNDKFNQSKMLRWKIEEYPPNCKKQDRPNFTSSSTNFARKANDYLTPSFGNQKNGFQPQGLNRKNVGHSKSYKTIVFSPELDQEYEKQKKRKNLGTTDYSRNDNKDLTASIGFKSSFKDLMSSTAVNYKCLMNGKETGEVNNPRRMDKCKSQKQIKIETKQNDRYVPFVLKQQFDTNKYINEYRAKSSKKIIDFEDKYAKFKQTQPINKSCKFIKDELPIRSKPQKTMSYKDLSEEIKQKSSAKRHLTAQSSRTFDMKEKERSKLCIEDFELGKCKGQGAFGQVFPAIHKTTKMLVAIKKVPKQKVKYMLQQFISEIKIQMFLNHPNIVSLYGVFDDPTNFYIIMEYMEGGNIYSLIKKDKKLKETQAAEKLKEICLGLKEMHDNSILHRDIKPENIVLTNGVSKLCDFGWSAICKDRRTTYCGTLDYVCPQIIQGQGYDDSVDIWCIGVLAYEMVCGKTPFYNISRKQTMKKIINVNYEYPSEISSNAKAFIDRILKRNPNERIGIDQVLNDKFLKI